MPSLPTLLFLTAPISYFTLEYLTSRATAQPYSYIRHHTSLLAYPYPFKDKDTHLPTRSPRAYWMKANFILNGLFHLTGQLHFINGQFLLTRKILAWMYCIGITLVAVDSGDASTPRGEKKQSPWHGLGAVMAILAGNLGSVLAGLGSGEEGGVYRGLSMGLGGVGLVGAVLSGVFVDGRWRGMWQRSAIYPIAMWMGVTGVTLMGRI
ncbi:uncharacterized protein RCC_09298 [Ramularia collo-cygni]|uniref:Integral membrane protein n=1 Tax=Ramularia collo-cygni TaxID=112498 RepID=A0A2D3VLT9_9PEZI|nr:uncharacterized protein RCC_09298 [Ramularia collo-cygni]CZT23584.1 uncharacterized protein RCC_09298 [Ramularia collo-cygni]